MTRIRERQENTMSKSTLKPHSVGAEAGHLAIPLIRAAATISFAIAPCSLGFLIVAVSEHLIRSIMVGDDPELLVSDLQNQFPHDVMAVHEEDTAGLLATVLSAIEATEPGVQRPTDGCSRDILNHVADALQVLPASMLIDPSRNEGARHGNCRP
jgi:hypothetical protein